MHAAQTEKKVFISYAWESDEFREKVKALVTWLRAQNVKVVADFDHANRPPSVGWPSWMQHSIEDATVVLVICSPKYKLRFEKRASPDSGKGVTWEGAVITQDLYDAAQRNDKFYPIFLDPENFDDVPKALQPWYTGHSFPAKQAGILALVLECFDAATTESKIVTPTTTSININGAPPSEPPPVVEPLPTSAERIRQSHASILGLLNQTHFAAFPQLSFAENGMPQIIEDVFSAPSIQIERKIIAERLLIAIRAFAKQFVAQFNELAGDSVLRVERSKNQFWKRFVNAMQIAILLSAKQNTASRERVAQAYNPEQPCEIAGMSWLSVSVLLREDLAESLRSNVVAPGAMDDPLRDHYAGDASEIELGTGPGAKIQLCKALKYILDGGSFPDQATQGQIEALAGELNLHKVDGKPVLLITQQTGKYGPEILRWLNHEMEVGHAIVLACNGEFELIEGRWRAYLVDLLKQLRDFEPAANPS